MKSINFDKPSKILAFTLFYIRCYPTFDILQIITTPDQKIISVSNTVEGKVHDKTLADDSYYLFNAPNNSKGLSDLGYLGIDTFGLQVSITTPHKKPRGKDLSDNQKHANRSFSSIRVRWEHVIGFLKNTSIFPILTCSLIRQ